jgi:hypothetical protein
MINSKRRTGQFVTWALVVALVAAGVRAGERQSGKSAAGELGRQRKRLLAELIEKEDSLAECHDLLKRRLLEGHLRDVKAGLELRDEDDRRIFEGYRFAQLRALCARAIFRRYSFRTAQLGWPSEEQGARLRQLARETTAAYEEPSDFERARVYARWHEAHVGRRFEADSLLLRRGSPVESEGKPVDKVLSSQVSRLRSATADALSLATADGEPLKADAKQVFLDVLTDEYRKLGRIGVPQDVFQDILKDLPDFLQKAIHARLLTEPQEERMTIRCHLWYALTGPRPDRIEDEFIGRQIEAVIAHIKERFTDDMPLGYADETARIFAERAELVRGNCFIARLKRPAWPFEWSEPSNKYQKSIEGNILDQIGRTVEKRLEVDRITARFGRSLRSDEDVQEQMSQASSQMAIALMSRLTTYQHLGLNRLGPDIQIGGSSGTTHKQSGIWLHKIKNSQRVPSYPWKKAITPVDSSRASTRQITRRVLRAMDKGDLATLDTLISESGGFSKEDMHELTGVLKGTLAGVASGRRLNIDELLIEKAWSWSAVRVQPSAEEADKTLALVFRDKQGGYWLAWAGLLAGPGAESLSEMLTRLKPGLELPPVPEPVEIAKPVDIASVDDVSEVKFLQSVETGHGWRVRLALADGDAAAPWKLLYCRAEWTGQDKPARPVPLGRYIARHLGPVVWTVSEGGFSDRALDLSGRPAPPMSIRGDGSVYAAMLPVSGYKQAYLQVYSAFDGRELARRQIAANRSPVWHWGRFMAHRKEEPFGVAAGFEAASPGMAAFKPLPAKVTGQSGPSIRLSVTSGFFSLKSDKRILPTRGSRLLARWWLNGKPVRPQPAEDLVAVDSSHIEGLARLLRLPVRLPMAVLKARPGDKVGLQVMLSPDRIESPSLKAGSSQCIASLDIRESPVVPVLSNRLDFKVSAGMIANRSSKTVTAASVKKLVEAIVEGRARTVRRLVSEYPQLAGTPDRSGQSPLEIVCRHRPRAKRLGPFRIGGDATVRHWKEMAEIAGILIDYGANVNARTRSSKKTPLGAIVDPFPSFGADDAPPVELVRTLLDRGADPELGSHKGTDLHQAVECLRSETSQLMAPVVKVLLEYGADVLAVREPWQRESVYERVDELTKQGHADLAGLIRQIGDGRRKVLEKAVHAGVEELLERLRHADEKALLSLKEELPYVARRDWLALGRSLQKAYGPGLEDVGDVEKLVLKGRWAEVRLPTKGAEDRGQLYILLMRYPGGAYHAVRAGSTEDENPGRYIPHAMAGYREFKNAVYSAFEWMDMCHAVGPRTTEYPARISRLSIHVVQDRLIARGLNDSFWPRVHAELTPDAVWSWTDTWELDISGAKTFATGDRKILMADGSLTVQNRGRTVVFTAAEGRVRMEADGKESLGKEFDLNLSTLEVER